MANRAKELALAILIKAKDEASAIFGGVTAKVTALFGAVSAFIGFKFLTSAIEDAGDFEKAMARVIAKTDDGKENAAELKKAAETIGPAYNVGAAEAAKGLEILGAAGLKANDAIKLLPTALALAKSEDISLERATELVVGAVTGMGQSFTDAAHDADVMVAAAKASIGSAADMGETMKYAAANARALGIDIDTLGAYTAVLAQNTVKGEMAGTGLRQTFAQMLDPSSNLRKALAGLGDTSGDFNKALETLSAAGPRGEAAIAGLDTEVANIVRNLLGSGIPTIQSLTEQFKNTTGAAQDTAKTMQDNLPSALSGLGVAWDLLKKYIAEPLLEPIKQQVRDLTQALKDAVSNGTLDSFRTSLVDAFNKGAESVKEFVAGMDLQQLLKNVQEFAAGAVSAFQTISDIGGKAAAVIQAAWNGAMTTIATMAAGIGNLIAGIKDGFASIASYLEKIGGAAAGEADRLHQEAESWREWATEWAGTGVKAFDATTDAINKLNSTTAASGEVQKNFNFDLKNVIKGLQEEETAAKGAAGTVVDLTKAVQDLQGVQQASGKTTDDLDAKVAALKRRYDELKASGTASIDDLAQALSDYIKALDQAEGKTNSWSKTVLEAFSRLGVEASINLKTAADNAVTDFETIKNSGVASVGDVNAAFAAMADKVLKAGQALSPMSEELATWKLKAMAATDEQGKALDDLIAKYQDSGTVAVAASNQQITAANQATKAVEDYSTRVEAAAGAGAQAFQNTTTAIQNQASAINSLNNSVTRSIQGYDELTAAGKSWAEQQLKNAAAADNSLAGTMLWRDETGRVVDATSKLIAKEKEAVQQVEALKAQYDSGSISISALSGRVSQLATQLQSPMTSAGITAQQTIRDLVTKVYDLNAASGTAGKSFDWLAGLAGLNLNDLKANLAQVSSQLNDIHTNAQKSVSALQTFGSINLR